MTKRKQKPFTKISPEHSPKIDETNSVAEVNDILLIITWGREESKY